MPSNVRLHDLQRWFARHGITLESGGRHKYLLGTVDGRRVRYTIATE